MLLVSSEAERTDVAAPTRISRRVQHNRCNLRRMFAPKLLKSTKAFPSLPRLCDSPNSHLLSGVVVLCAAATPDAHASSPMVQGRLVGAGKRDIARHERLQHGLSLRQIPKVWRPGGVSAGASCGVRDPDRESERKEGHRGVGSNRGRRRTGFADGCPCCRPLGCAEAPPAARSRSAPPRQGAVKAPQRRQRRHRCHRQWRRQNRLLRRLREKLRSQPAAGCLARWRRARRGAL